MEHFFISSAEFILTPFSAKKKNTVKLPLPSDNYTFFKDYQNMYLLCFDEN